MHCTSNFNTVTEAKSLSYYLMDSKLLLTNQQRILSCLVLVPLPVDHPFLPSHPQGWLCWPTKKKENVIYNNNTDKYARHRVEPVSTICE